MNRNTHASYNSEPVRLGCWNSLYIDTFFLIKIFFKIWLGAFLLVWPWDWFQFLFIDKYMQLKVERRVVYLLFYGKLSPQRNNTCHTFFVQKWMQFSKMIFTLRKRRITFFSIVECSTSKPDTGNIFWNFYWKHVLFWVDVVHQIWATYPQEF